MHKYLYLLVDLVSFIFPFLFSFEKKWLYFIGRWKAIFLGLSLMAIFFLVWDVKFTSLGIWGFNDYYVLGIYWLGLPIEEYLFFLFIGYSCLFLYESMSRIISLPFPDRYFRTFFIGWGILNIFIAFCNWDKAYTFAALGLNGLGLLILAWLYPGFPWKKFFLGYLVSFIPFTLVNGILTGGFTADPVVWYNSYENLGLRLNTIPIEDSQYMMLMMSMSIAIYEYFNKSQKR